MFLPSAVASAAASAPGAAAVTLTAEETKFLGGDVEHTHLVRGLDFALLQKMRREEKKRAKEEAEEKEEEGHDAERGGGGDEEGRAAVPPSSSSLLPLPTPESELGRVALSTLLVGERRKRKQWDTRRAAESFLPRRTAYLFDLSGDDEGEGDAGGEERGAAPSHSSRRSAPLPRGLGFPLELGAPTTLVRAAADCPKPRALISSTELESGGGGGGGSANSLLERLAKIMLYVSGGASSGGGKKKRKKKGRGEEAGGTAVAPAATAPFPLFGGGAELSVDAATASAAFESVKAAAAGKEDEQMGTAAEPVDADDDIFGDAGRDYEPTVEGVVAGPVRPLPPPGGASFDAEAAYGSSAYPTADEHEEEAAGGWGGSAREEGVAAKAAPKSRTAAARLRRRADGVGDRAARRAAVAPGGLEADDEEDAYAELYPGMAGFGREAYSDEDEEDGKKRELPDPAAEAAAAAAGNDKKRRKPAADKPEKEDKRLDSDLGKIREILEVERGADVAGAFGDTSKADAEAAEATLAAAAGKRRRRLG